LFIFDLFLDADYPVTPPKMAFVLNGNDSDAHSFNPNLHRGGGVCLSILNTWSGSAAERWQPNKSTILAVLISIQAMILGAPVPWINEPGYEGQAGTKQAQDHKLLIQTKTINYAMISWLENEFKSPNAVEFVWKDISQTYWKHNGMEALGHVREWAKENPALASYDPANPTGTKKPKKGKGKSKASTADPEPAPARSSINLVEKLERLLGIEVCNISSDLAYSLQSCKLTLTQK
jgi:baculoviral IAP repeat-containing protein 6